MAIALPRIVCGLIAFLMATACTAAPESAPTTTSAAPSTLNGQCQRAGPLCRPLLATTVTKCAGPQQTRVALGYPDAIGPGPVYPGISPIREHDRSSTATKNAPFTAATKTQDFDGRPLPDGPWHYNKVIWWRSVEYPGPVLIRTSAVGHDGQARIQRDGFADSSFFPSTQPGSVPVPERNAFGYSSGIWVSKPGCYAWQIDGEDFSYVIYFNAVLE